MQDRCRHQPPRWPEPSVGVLSSLAVFTRCHALCRVGAVCVGRLADIAEGRDASKGGREMLLTALSSMGPRVPQPRPLETTHLFTYGAFEQDGGSVGGVVLNSRRAGWAFGMRIESNVEAFWERKTQLSGLIELAAVALAIKLFAVCLRDAHVLVFVDTECVRKHLVKSYSLDIDLREVAGRLLTVTRRDW